MIDYIELMGWVFTIASLVGNVFVNYKKIQGMYLWAAVNLCWVGYDFYFGMDSQAFLFLAYTGFCIWGIYQWRKKPEECKKKHCKCKCHKKSK